MQSYAQSKLANVVFAYELQRRLCASGSSAIGVASHPGWAATNMGVDQQPRPLARMLHWLTMRIAPAAQGALPALFAATSPDVHGGEYIGPTGPFGVSGSPAKWLVISSDVFRDAKAGHRAQRRFSYGNSDG